MQDLFSFVQTKSSPLSTASNSVNTDVSGTQTPAQEGAFAESFFAIILGKLTQEENPQTLEELPIDTTTSAATENLLTAGSTDEAKPIDEHLLEDLLSIVNALQQDSQTTNFPTLKASSNLEKILNSETARQDFANVKNVSDLLEVSKKYDLGLEKLSISKESVESLQTKFPKLTQNNFFDEITTALKQMQTEPRSTAQTTQQTTIPTQVGLMSLLDNQQPKTQPVPQTQSILGELIAKESSSEATHSQQPITTSSKPLEETSIVNEKQQTLTQKIVNNTASETKMTDASMQQKNDPHADDAVKSSIEVSTKPLETVIQKALHDVKQEMKKSEVPTQAINENDATTQETPIAKPNDLKAEVIQKSDAKNDESLVKSLKQEKTIDTTNDELSSAQTAKPLVSEEVKSSSEDIQSTPDIKTDSTVKITTKQDFNTNKPTTTKESLSQFASDLKEQIETYKPPIMKVELSLSPKSLGDVDVTLLTRGNNLHVNISSNTTTMNLFTQNQDEVKSALVNMGFTNLEMNFSDQRNSEQSQHHQKQNSGNFKEFGAEQTEEDTALLEIVIPQYV
ncbi:MAG TPA: flagellar hook-length control protein FliK [Sulfurospirillum cavolei]|uniref:Flagellar hook-length control protein FliK n=1 Tax=Sulfurospirillum cavolei TaxID=366522 RepID=A0A2D3W7A3_9BACT|nr:MAG TPA: flagellar hook-length control protein FliK [Sulfurospirillum cavolei]